MTLVVTEEVPVSLDELATLSQASAQSLSDRPTDEPPTDEPPAGEPPTNEPPTGFTTKPAPPPRRRGRILLRLLAISLALGLLLATGGAATALWFQHRYDHNIERFGDPFKAIPEASRPKAVSAGVMNVLLLGSDSRISAGDPSDWVYGAQRTDAIMIAHIPADRSGATITSIPRDSWVNIPGYGMNKINAAFSYGGTTLLVQTLEKLTGVRLDHVLIVDFDGFKEITDELGGVKINVQQSTHDERSSFTAGVQTMDGAAALNYVRQRHNLPGGDFDRVRRQQNWVRAVSMKMLAKGTLTNPLKLNRVLGSLTKSIAADDDFTIGSMRSLALSMRDVRGSDLTFLTAPVAGTGRSPDGKQDIVKLNTTANRALWQAVADDTVDDWLKSHQAAPLGTKVR